MQIYTEQMSRRHDFGYPMYEPAASKVIQPGMVGYLDEHGQWNPVADVSSESDLAKEGLTTVPGGLQQAPDDQDIAWGPKVSEHVKATRISYVYSILSTPFLLPSQAS